MTAEPTAALRIEGELTIYHAAELKQMLLPLPSGNDAIELDLSRVSEIDSAGVQLLLLARREASRAGREWRLGATSPAVDEAFALLDLHGHFGVSR